MATRRAFLLRTLAFVGAAVSLRVPSIYARTNRFGSVEGVAAKLVACIDAQRSAAMVGLEYLRTVPSEANAEQLVRLICAKFPERHGELARTGTRQIKRLVMRQQQEDFAADRIIDVGGWILSRSEARLYALVAISAGARLSGSQRV
jgi:hypothetical protein